MLAVLSVVLGVVATLAAVAVGQGRRAKASERVARQNLYAAEMNLVQAALNSDNVGRAKALLKRHHLTGPDRDLCGFEWRYLWERCRGDFVFGVSFRFSKCRYEC